jgi:surface protein
MSAFLYNQGNFNQDISNWNVDNVTNFSNFGYNNYSKIPPKFRPPIEEILRVSRDTNYDTSKLIRVTFTVAGNRNPIDDTSIYIQTSNGSGYPSIISVSPGNNQGEFHAIANTGAVIVSNNYGERIDLIKIFNSSQTIQYSEKTNIYIIN